MEGYREMFGLLAAGGPWVDVGWELRQQHVVEKNPARMREGGISIINIRRHGKNVGG